MSDAWGRAGEPAVNKGDHYHHPDLREAMIQVAQGLVETDGPGSWTVRAAARIAGVSSGAPYRHFADKDALLAAVAARAFDALCESLEAEFAAGDALPALERLAATYVNCAGSMPGRYQILYGRELLDPAAHPETSRAADRLFALLVRIVEAAQRAGTLPVDAPSDDLAHALWASWHGLAHLTVAGRTPHDRHAAVAALSLRAFGPR